MTPYNPFMGQKIRTDAPGISVDAAFLAHFQVSAANAIAPSATSVLTATALIDVTQAIKTNITNPAVPRNITISGNASGITGDVVIKGTNYVGEAITETVALNGTGTVAGSKAFMTVTEIDLPIETHAGTDTVSVGTGSKLGLPYKLAHNTVLKAFLDNTDEGTAPTVTIDTANIENNTISLVTSLSSKVVDAYLVV